MNKTFVCIAAYDAGMHTSEGHVARQILRNFSHDVSILLVTRRNNVQALKEAEELSNCDCKVRLIGYDLPRWASWWKKGPRGYALYAYLWQLTWPLIFLSKSRLRHRIDIFHSLNFHNDSIPNFSWILRKPNVWGPINHNEPLPKWRLDGWPSLIRHRTNMKYLFRRFFWNYDPFLKLSTRKSSVILYAGSWVERRLSLSGQSNTVLMSQLGVPKMKPVKSGVSTGGLRLIFAGRLDRIKGVDIAIRALRYLPNDSNLTVVGSGNNICEYKNLAESLGVLDRITFCGALEQNELFSKFFDADLFVFPSAEAAGLVWVEALANGLPVLGIHGESELSKNHRSLLGAYCINAGATLEETAKNYADRICSLSQMPHDSDQIASIAQKNYSWLQLSRTLQQIYVRLKR